jgi:hypothetical protein
VRLNRAFNQNPVPAPWRVILLCGLLTFLLRLPTFFRSVLDWDESLYTLMASQWLAGHLPYTTIWDNKPLGIYAVFALFEAVFRNPVLAIRAATVVFTSALACLLWRLTFLLCAEAPPPIKTRLAWLAALSFIFSALSNDGLAANTELFMECFSAAAILAAIDPRFCAGRPMRRAFCTGVLFSLACMTKYVAVFEAPAIAFALLAANPITWRDAAKRCGAAVAGACVVPGCTILTYAAAGDLGLWWSCSIASNVTRVAAPFSVAQLRSVALIILPRWAPAIAAALLLLATMQMDARKKHFTAARRAHALLGLWLIGGTIGVMSAKSFYDHYFLQILPPACLALAFMAQGLSPALLNSRRNLTALTAALLLIPGVAGVNALAAIIAPLETKSWPFGFGPDAQARIAAALRPNIAAGARIYVFDSQPIIYALANAAPPTRFVLPSVLTQCFLPGVAGVNPTREVGRILAANPDYIIRKRTAPATQDSTVYAELNEDLAARYALWRGFGDADVYKLRPDPPPLTPFLAPDSCATPNR